MELIWKTSTTSPLPPAAYICEFKGVDNTTHEQYGAGLSWKFEVIKPQAHAGKTISRITGLTPTPKNGCGKMVMGLLGGTPNEGEHFDVKQYIGKRYICLIAASDKGPRLESIAPDTPTSF